MTRSPLNRLRSAYRRVVATGDATQAATERLEATVGDLRGQVDRLTHDVDRLTHRLYESAGIVDDIRAVTGTRPLAAADDLAWQRAQIVDAVNYSVRRRPLPPGRTRVLFLVHHIEAWDSLDSVVRALGEAPDFDVVVASIPRKFRGAAGFSDEDLVHRGLDARGIPHLRITQESDDDRLALVRALTPDVIFRQSQWDDDVPAAFSTRNLSFARLCLVSYEMIGFIHNQETDTISNTALDSYYHRAAWRVFSASPLSKAIAARDGARAGEQFVVTGHPKADRLRTAPPAWPVARGDGDEPRARIVWSAHHSITDEWISFGMAHLVAKDMLEWARSSPDLDFVLMPHPALRPFIDDPSSPVTPAEADEFVAQWSALPNTTIFCGGDYAPVFAASDVMIVDGVSFLVEYQFQGKPLIFLERQDHAALNEIGDIIRTGTHPVPDITQARIVVEQHLAGQLDSLADQQRDNMERIFGAEPAATRIVAELRAAVAEERSTVG